MPHNRFYFCHPLETGKTITLSEEESAHLRVYRVNTGEEVEIINGRNQLARAKMISWHKKQALLSVESLEQASPHPPVIIVSAISRMNHLEWMCEKATELGATKLWLFPGMWSEKQSLSPNQIERLQHLCVAAMKQCGRLDLPLIEIKPPLLQWTPLEQASLFFGDTHVNAPYLWTLDLPKPFREPILFFNGPEKGFAPQEEAFLREVLHAKGVRLHPYILRTETAPLAFLSLISSLC